MIEYNNYSLLSHNTFGIDVKADRFVEYNSVEELLPVLTEIRTNNIPFLHIGEGSNLLFSKDFHGVVLHSSIKDVTVAGESDTYVDLKVGAGVRWDDFVAYTVSKNLYGAENLSLIPGEVGASAVQNIGAYGREAKDIIQSVEAVEVSTGNIRIFTNTDCDYSYRHSIFKAGLKGKYIITYVTYRLNKAESYDLDYGNVRKELESEGCDVTLQNVRNVVIKIRKQKLPNPKEMGNAGSFFMNPVVGAKKFNELIALYPSMPHYVVGEESYKIPAAWLIQQCGFKGFKTGHVGVHHIQPLVLVNLGGADAQEVVDLAKRIVDSIANRFGIKVVPEVNYI